MCLIGFTQVIKSRTDLSVFSAIFSETILVILKMFDSDSEIKFAGLKTKIAAGGFIKSALFKYAYSQ